jgi:RNA polymerase sigma-70 factor (ECF subfamily)
MGLFGVRGSLQKLVDEHYMSLYRYAHRLSGSASEAEDLTQESFCKAQENFAQLRDPARAKAWLFRILRNTYLQKVRVQMKQPCITLEDLSNLPEHLPESLPIVEPQRLREALAELPEPFRTPVILYYLEDFSYREIAEQMDVPLGTVMSRLSRAKAHLRARLLQSYVEEAVHGARRATDAM